MTLGLRYAARSHVGLLREGNEDSVYAGPRLLAVADGMGGHAAGEVASAVAIAALAPLDEDAPGTDLLDALRRSAMAANEHLRDMVAGDPALDGMGTTLTALLSAGSRLGLLHIGDSRAYLLRDGELGQITHDHTLVQALVDEGRLSEQEANTHPQRSLVTRALDGRDGIELDLSVREVRVGDRYLLCSDGLTGPVGSRDTLLEALQLPEPQEAVDRLVALALRGGGPDNVTVIVADVVDEDHVAQDRPIVAGAAAEAPQSPPPGISDSAAGRAHAAGREAAIAAAPADGEEPTPPAPPARRRRGRAALVALGIVGLLVAGAGAGWAYVRTQFYVGEQNGYVAVFRGVRGSVAGISLASLDHTTTLEVRRLSDLVSGQVEGGIIAEDRLGADQIVARLERQADELCPVRPPTVLPTATPKPTAVPNPTATPAIPSAASPCPVGP